MALQARLAGERREAFAARIEGKGRDARQRQAGQLRQRLMEQIALAAEQRGHEQGRRQRPTFAQRADELPSLIATAGRGDRTYRLIARLTGNTLGPLARQHCAAATLKSFAIATAMRALKFAGSEGR